MKLSPPMDLTMFPKVRAVIVFAGIFLCLAPLLFNRTTVLCIVRFSVKDSSAAAESARIKRFVSAIFISNIVITESIDLIKFVFGPEIQLRLTIFYYMFLLSYIINFIDHVKINKLNNIYLPSAQNKITSVCKAALVT